MFYVGVPCFRFYYVVIAYRNGEIAQCLQQLLLVLLRFNHISFWLCQNYLPFNDPLYQSIIVFLLLLQSPWGVATGAIAGHLVATSIAILGGAFLANYISEKLVRPMTFYHRHKLQSLSCYFSMRLTLIFQSGWLLGWSAFPYFCRCHIFWIFLINAWGI